MSLALTKIQNYLKIKAFLKNKTRFKGQKYKKGFSHKMIRQLSRNNWPRRSQWNQEIQRSLRQLWYHDRQLWKKAILSIPLTLQISWKILSSQLWEWTQKLMAKNSRQLAVHLRRLKKRTPLYLRSVLKIKRSRSLALLHPRKKKKIIQINKLRVKTMNLTKKKAKALMKNAHRSPVVKKVTLSSMIAIVNFVVIQRAPANW